MQTCIDEKPKTNQLAQDKSKQRELLKRYGKVTPGSTAEAEMVEQYLPLVKHVVGRLAMTLPPHVDIEDLNSSGMVGLLSAVRNYDPTAGSTFESYARVRIRGAVFDELRRLDWVPRSLHDKARKVQQACQEVEQKKGRIPTNEEVAKAMKMDVDEYEKLLEEIKPATFVCLDSVQTGNGEREGESSRYESVADESQEDPSDVAVRHEMAGVIAERLELLPEMQRKVLALYYFEGLRLREIAVVFGVTESRICQVHSQAILNIRTFLKNYDRVEN